VKTSNSVGDFERYLSKNVTTLQIYLKCVETRLGWWGSNR